ncbi:MAG: hypothetical protein WD716_05930 [Fimbriimonadaceae bacterium]
MNKYGWLMAVALMSLPATAGQEKDYSATIAANKSKFAGAKSVFLNVEVLTDSGLKVSLDEVRDRVSLELMRAKIQFHESKDELGYWALSVADAIRLDVFVGIDRTIVDGVYVVSVRTQVHELAYLRRPSYKQEFPGLLVQTYNFELSGTAGSARAIESIYTWTSEAAKVFAETWKAAQSPKQ